MTAADYLLGLGSLLLLAGGLVAPAVGIVILAVGALTAAALFVGLLLLEWNGRLW
jgi:hypothetical protein